MQDRGSVEKINPKGLGPCIFTLLPCGNRCCSSESAVSIFQVHPPSNMKLNARAAFAKVAFNTVRQLRGLAGALFVWRARCSANNSHLVSSLFWSWRDLRVPNGVFSGCDRENPFRGANNA